VSDLGQLLRKARMDRKISLDDLQESTKIRKRYLEAIEDGNYKVLPGSFYVRAFIKSYAEAVGLDPIDVLNMYQSAIPSLEPEKPAVDTIRTKRTVTTKNTDKLSRWASNIMMISFVVLILGVIYYYAYQNYKGSPAKVSPTGQSPRLTDTTDPKANTATDKKPQALPTPSPSLAPTPTPVSAQTVVQFSSSEKGVDNYTVTGAAKLDIQMKIVGTECWIQVDALTEGNKRVLQKQKLYKNGDTDAFNLDSSAFLNIGAASAVELKVNNTIITVGDTPNPKKVQLNLQKS
jgi:cytoskeletal protein RodZ